MNKLQALGDILSKGETPYIVVNTFDKIQLQALIASVKNVELSLGRLSQIQTLIKICSYCHLATEEMQQLCDKLLALQPQIDTSSIIYQKFYASPELIPQQYIGVIQDKLLPSTTAEKHTQYIVVYYLLDQVVGYVFQDGTTWYAGNRISKV